MERISVLRNGFSGGEIEVEARAKRKSMAALRGRLGERWTPFGITAFAGTES
jgi:hypothetical protein